MPRVERLPAKPDLPSLRLPLAGEGLEQLVLALAFERRDAEHLARADRERDALHGAEPEVLGLQHGVDGLGLYRRRRRLLFGDLRRLRLRTSRFGAEHDLDDPGLAAFLRDHRPDVHPVAQDRRPVAGVDHLA